MSLKNLTKGFFLLKFTPDLDKRGLLWLLSHFMGKLTLAFRRILITLIASTSRGKKYLTRLKLRRRGSFLGCTLISLVTRPILEKDRFRAFLGAPLAAAVVIGGVSTISQDQVDLLSWSVGEPLPEAIMSVDLVIPSETNQSSYTLPTPEILGISQGYHLGHPGIDLRAPLHSPVFAMRSGTVTQVFNDSVGFGKHLYIEHSPFVTSLYAHLNTISVAPGDVVNAAQSIGTIGLTGWSTGPHLHLEIYVEGKAVNPLPLLKPALSALPQKIVISTYTATASPSGSPLNH